MSNKTAVLAVRIVTDAKAGKAGLDDYGNSVQQLEKNLNKLAVPAALVVGALAAEAKAATDAAVEHQNAGKTVQAVYGANAAAVEDYADKAAQAAGLSASSYEQMAGIIGEQLKNLGVAQQDLAPQTNQLIQLGADLAAQYGGDTTDAVQTLENALRGQTKGLAAYGIEITKARVNTELQAEGLGHLTGSALQAATQQATLKLLLAQTGDVQDRFTKGSADAAQQQAILTASWADAQEKLGTDLLPILDDAVGILDELAGWIDQNSGLALAFGITLGLLAGAVLVAVGAVKAYEIATGAAEAAQWLLNIAMDANPIGLVIIAVGALIGIILLLVTHWKEVSQFGGQVWDGFVDGIKTAWQWVQDLIDQVGKLFGLNGGWAAFDHWGSGGGGTDDFPGDDFPPPDGGTGGWPDWPAGLGSSSTAAVSQTVNNWTINGAIDPSGTARQIRSVVDRNGKNTGVLTVGSASFLG